MALYKQTKYNEAARQFELAFREAATCNVTIRPIYVIQELLSNIALCYTKINLPDSSLYYYEAAISYIDKHSKDFGEPYMAKKAKGVIYGNMAGIYFNKHYYDVAEALMKMSISINVQPRYENADAQKTKIKLARLYFEKNDTISMFQTLMDLRRSMDTLHDESVEQNWREMMYLYFFSGTQNYNLKGYGSYVRAVRAF